MRYSGLSLVRGFIRSAGIILTVTALAKLLSTGGGVQILQNLDPVFYISYRHLFWLAGAVEAAVAAVCFFGTRLDLKVFLVSCLATTFSAYRLCELWLAAPGYCKCLGYLTDFLHISPAVASACMAVILIYLLIGSYTSLFFILSQRNKDIRAEITSIQT